jgi:hypothetical protein
MEFDQARAAPLEFLAIDSAMTAGNMGPPGQQIHGPPQAMRPWQVAGQSQQLNATIESPSSTKLLLDPSNLKNRGFATAFS